MRVLLRWVKVLAVGLLAGLVGALLMTLVMALLRFALGISPPPESLPDRLAPTFKVNEFLKLLHDYGGYNKLKQFGVRTGILAQLGAGTAGGLLYAYIVEVGRSSQSPARRWRRGSVAVAFGVVLVWIALLVVLLPVLPANYRGLPPRVATVVTALGLLVSFASYGLGVILAYRYLAGNDPITRPDSTVQPIGRRAFLTAGAGAVLALASGGMIRLMFDRAVFAYDGMRNRGPRIAPVTPVEKFYVVTKNVSDPYVFKPFWRLEVNGQVEHPRTYSFDDLASMPSTTQQTTLMCISNGVGDKLISNGLWKGVPMRTLLAAAAPRQGSVEVVLHGADGYTDTFELAKAMEPTTLVVYEMNDGPIPQRHGYPVRVIVPGKFGEKNVKWVTRIEVVDHQAKGFYEQQGWGPNFNVPIRSGFYAAGSKEQLQAGATIPLQGFAFAPTVGVSKVEVSVDGGRTWQEATIDYPGTLLTWSLWSYSWRPARPGNYRLVVRATNKDGEPQISRYRGIVPEGGRGYHTVTRHVT